MTNATRGLWFAIYVVTSVTGLAILKTFLPRVSFPFRDGTFLASRTILWISAGAVLYAISFTVWMVILRSVPLAVAYPVAVGATLCGTTVVAVIVLGERIGASQGAGIGLILIGILLIFRGP